MTDTRDFSNTRCFIDFDSTLADSLPRYNVVLDDLYKDKVVEENYIEYYRDFGDAFDIIPGSPWKSILMDLVEYHAKIREVGPYSNGGSRWAPTSAVYDAGRMDALMKVVFDADRCGNHPAVPAVYYKGASASYMGTTNIHHMDGGKHHWMLNLGLLREPVNETVVRFNDAGTYTLDKLCVYARSADAIRESIAGLNHVTQDLSFAPNAVSLSLDTETDAYLFSAIPYSEGWRAYDNGEPTDILNADVGFMALRLTPGHHDIRFAYHTPGLMIGFCISILSLGSYFAFRAIQKKREKAVKA